MRIFTFCGESSGDLYAWLLLKETKHQVVGIGGERLSQIVNNRFMDIHELNVLGISSKSIMKSAKKLNSLKKQIISAKPDLFLPVSYPGINLPLARAVRKHGIKVYYLLPPQIWAWGSFRKRYLRKLDLVISVFPFEKEYLKGIKSIYIGNPLVEFLKTYRKNKPKADLIGLLPGSRPNIIKRNLELLIKVATALKNHLRFRIFIKDHKPELPEFIEVYKGDHYEGMRECAKVIVKLGTASLEAAILGIPQVAFFIPSKADYILKPLLKTDEFSIVNKILGRKAIKNFINPDIDSIVSALNDLPDQDLYPELQKLLRFDKNKLSEAGLV